MTAGVRGSGMEEGKFLEGKISGEGDAVERKLEARVGRIVGDAELQVRSRVGRGESAVRGWRREVRTTKLEGRVQDRETVEDGVCLPERGRSRRR